MSRFLASISSAVMALSVCGAALAASPAPANADAKMSRHGVPLPVVAKTPEKPKGVPKATIPFVPPVALESALEMAPVFAEVYPLAAKEVPSALEKAARGEPPVEQAVALVLPGALFLQFWGEQQELPEINVTASRKGAPVEYAEQCGEYPQTGDQLLSVYGVDGSDVSAELNVRVVRHMAFGSDSDKPLDLKKAGSCQLETHSRTFFSGQLNLRFKGKVVQSTPILMQSIVDPQ